MGLVEWLMRLVTKSSRVVDGIRAARWREACESWRFWVPSCAAFSHTWKSVAAARLILGLVWCVESVLIFGYTPRKPLSSVHFITLKSLLQVLRRHGSSRSLYIDCCFANRMTERQTVQWVLVFVLSLYVLLVFALWLSYFPFRTSDLSLSLPFLFLSLFLIFLYY